MDKSDETAFVTSIVYALTEYKDVDSVMFDLSSSDKLPFGTEMNKLYYKGK